MSTGIACGVPLKNIVAGIEAVDIIPGRCEIIDEGQPFSVVVSGAGVGSCGWLAGGLAGGAGRAATGQGARLSPACCLPWLPLPATFCFPSPSRSESWLNSIPWPPAPYDVQVDSASTPEQLSRLLDEVKEAGSKRVLLVFGCPGTTSVEQRAAMTQAGSCGWPAAGGAWPAWPPPGLPPARSPPWPPSRLPRPPNLRRSPLNLPSSLLLPPPTHPQMAHYKADAIFITNDSPGASWPSDVIADMVGGLPTEVTNKYTGTAYPFLQDPHRVPHWFQKYMLQYQSVVGVYVIEDRFQGGWTGVGACVCVCARVCVCVCVWRGACGWLAGRATAGSIDGWRALGCCACLEEWPQAGTPTPLSRAPAAAIRVAIGMARARDVVVVAGKGHIDWQEYWDGAEFDLEERTTLKVCVCVCVCVLLLLRWAGPAAGGRCRALRCVLVALSASPWPAMHPFCPPLPLPQTIVACLCCAELV